MNNFTFQNPVKLIFGEGQIAQLSKMVKPGFNVLITYGGGSIKSNGVYEQVIKNLAHCNVIEFSGIEPNPDYSTLMKAIAICKTKKIDLILAVGGGSVIDGTKFIAAGANYDGDPWDFMIGKAHIPSALPFACVLTLPATASEMNNGGVISRREFNEKYAFNNPDGFPQFSILDPTTVYSLPKKQISNGIIDTFIHVVEQYITTPDSLKVMDRFSESILNTLVEIAPKVMAAKIEYQAAADFMLSATMGLNGFSAMGVDQDWATHMIGHELTALHGIDHGATLAIVYIGTMHVMRKEKEVKLLQYAERVWNISEGTTNERIDAAIAKTEAFFNSLGQATRLSDYGVGQETIDTIVSRFRERKWNLGENGIVTPEKAEAILISRL